MSNSRPARKLNRVHTRHEPRLQQSGVGTETPAPAPPPRGNTVKPTGPGRNHGLPFMILAGVVLALSFWVGPIASTLLWAGPPPAAAGSTGSPAAAGSTGSAADPAPENPWAIHPGAADRIRAAGLPVSTDEGILEHFHSHLDVFVDGKAVTVPTGIGYPDIAEGQSGARSPLHTQDASGILYIEAKTPGQRFTLGQVLQEWGVISNTGAIGGLPAEGWAVFINGKGQTTSVYSVFLHPKDEIALIHGTAPVKIPSSYNFPPNL
ncbi:MULTISPECIES: hypothetical protein [Arthrobacter]|uniref:Uncharacterized protein n=1 Tax=Arthrobacter terricola TaxID=2547396 RepID=A0A4R5KBW9_9MICC|nr:MULTISPECIES: hypothetical protein [Arthrobacter]MBT8161762.1 hypothetical protein [Arthrobacter sp. GN70]TDF92671.1 hypothetical protein E1809_17620 [Arthrobacter terricola]